MTSYFVFSMLIHQHLENFRFCQRVGEACSKTTVDVGNLDEAIGYYRNVEATPDRNDQASQALLTKA